MKARFLVGILLLLMVATLSAVAKDISATVIYDDRATDINPAQTPDGTDQLWVTTAELTRATRFEVKPQGVCREELCFPLPKARHADFLRKQSGKEWFNLTAFAELVHQPVARDTATSTWYFGPRSDPVEKLPLLRAPSFTRPALAGHPPPPRHSG